MALFISSLASPVVGFFRNDPSHASAWIGAVSRIAGNQVDVQMADGLPSRGAVVYADVVSGRTKLELKLLLRCFNQFEHRHALLDGRVKERSHVPCRYHQCVPCRDRIGIAKGNRKVVTQQDSLPRQGTERALGAFHNGRRLHAGLLSHWGVGRLVRHVLEVAGSNPAPATKDTEC